MRISGQIKVLETWHVAAPKTQIKPEGGSTEPDYVLYYDRA